MPIPQNMVKRSSLAVTTVKINDIGKTQRWTKNIMDVYLYCEIVELPIPRCWYLKTRENGSMDSRWVKYYAGNLVLNSVLLTNMPVGGSKNWIKKVIRIGTYSITTLYKTGALEAVLRETENSARHMVAIEKVRWEGQDSIWNSKYICYRKRTHFYNFGIGCLIKKEPFVQFRK